MTESEWLSCEDSLPMLRYLREAQNARERKARLFATACCRSIWHLINRERCRKWVGLAERFADGLATNKALAVERKCLAVLGTPVRYAAHMTLSPTAWFSATETATNAQTDSVEVLPQAVLLRDIFGKPNLPNVARFPHQAAGVQQDQTPGGQR